MSRRSSRLAGESPPPDPYQVDTTTRRRTQQSRMDTKPLADNGNHTQKVTSKEVNPEQVAPLGADHDGKTSRCASFSQRLKAGLSLFALFCVAIHLGHIALIPLLFLIQLMMYREVVHLSYSHLLNQEQAKHIPLFRTQNYLWFITSAFYIYSRALHVNLNIEVPYYLFISFALLMVGFVGFVLSLRKEMYRVQFGMFAWSWLAIIIFVLMETTALMSVMFQGLIWLVLPAIIVMSNDSWAYVWGLLFGRTSLISLSPKKTWEGFIGAFFSTCLMAFVITRWMIPFPILTCPQTILTFTHPQCVTDPTFVLQEVALPFTIPYLEWSSILIAPIQWHAVYMSIFSGIIAPFGGFFASGFKRAFKIKDFGSSIPGHGGFVDRMDCQLVMGLFVYVYYWTFVKYNAAGECTAVCLDMIMHNNSTTVSVDILKELYMKLSPIQQAEFIQYVK